MTTTVKIQPNELQQKFIQDAVQWFKSGKEQFFILKGYAGTGKTTVLDMFIEELKINKGSIHLCAPTGKAAVRAGQATGLYATTVHGFIYTVKLDSNGKMHFTKKSKDDVSGVKLIIADESSMIKKDMFDDLLSFGIKVLFVGDGGQLQPVYAKNEQPFSPMISFQADAELTQVMRQRGDSPILDLATDIRSGAQLHHVSHPEMVTFNHFDMNSHLSVANRGDIVVVRTNATRKTLNSKLRQLRGFSSPLPMVGDRVICTLNNHDIGMMNGMICEVTGVHEDSPHKSSFVCLTLYSEDLGRELKNILIEKAILLNEKKMDWKSKRQALAMIAPEYTVLEMEYAYAITCHKSQGSQWDNVVVIDERTPYPDRGEWLYTAVTRAAKKLIVFSPQFVHANGDAVNNNQSIPTPPPVVEQPTYQAPPVQQYEPAKYVAPIQQPSVEEKPATMPNKDVQWFNNPFTFEKIRPTNVKPIAPQTGLYKVAVTGHRPDKLGGYKTCEQHQLIQNKLYEVASRLYSKNKGLHFISGMALGVDTWFAQLAVHVRQQAPNVFFEAAVPCQNQESQWVESSRKEYQALLKNANHVTMVNDAPYTNRCMQDRNEYMVDSCHVLISVWDGTEGGTANCVKYARKHNKAIIFINPQTGAVTVENM